jgi:hypothetical protein
MRLRIIGFSSTRSLGEEAENSSLGAASDSCERYPRRNQGYSSLFLLISSTLQTPQELDDISICVILIYRDVGSHLLESGHIESARLTLRAPQGSQAIVTAGL